MSSNNPYNDRRNSLDKLIGTTALAGSGYLAYKAVTDAEGFQKNMMKVANVIMPVQNASQTTEIRKSQIADIKARILAMEKPASERRKILDNIKTQKTRDTLTKGEWKKTMVSYSDIGEEIASVGREFRFTDPSQVKDISGESIGNQFTEALNSLGLKVQGKPTFKGTTGIFRVMEDGRETTIEIPFAAREKETGAWISKKGDAEFVVDYVAKASKHETKGISIELKGHNEAMLEMLRSKESISSYAAMDKDFIRDFKQIAEGKIKDLKKIREITQAASAANILESRSQSEIVKRALKGFAPSKENWTVTTDKLRKSALSGVGKIDPISLIDLNPEMPGAGSRALSTDAAAQDISKLAKYAGETFESILGFPQQFNQEIKRGDYSRVTLKYKGKVITPDNLHIVEDEETRKLYSTVLSGDIGFSLSQSQTADLGFSMRPSNKIMQVEREKSEKGLLFSENLGAKPINGIAKGKIERVRNIPTTIERSLIDDKSVTGYLKSQRDIFSGEKKGLVNMFGMINPVGHEEYIGVAGDFYKDMHAFQPRQWSVSSIASKGLDDASRVDIEIVEQGKRKFLKDRRLSELIENQELIKQLKSSDSMTVKIRKGTILGERDAGGLLWDEESTREMLGREGKSIYRAQENMIMNKNDYMETLRANADLQMMHDGTLTARDPNAPLKFLGQVEGKMTKGGIYGRRDRSVIYGRIEKETVKAAKAAGISASVEWAPHIDIYKKILPQAGERGVHLQKGSPEMMQFLQESLMGHLLAYSNEQVKLRGNIAQRFRDYLQIGKGEHLNLTKVLTSGMMQWTSNIHDETAFGAQLHDVASVLGAMKEHTRTSGGNVVFDDKTFNSELGAQRLAEAWDRMTGKEAKSFFRKLHKNEVVTQEDARSFTWGLFSGMMPQEIKAMSQGSGWNSMDIGFKDMSFFMDKAGILEEFAYQNMSNSIKIASELKLMGMSMAGDEQFPQALKAYEERVGSKIPIYTPGELNENVLGGYGGSTYTSDIKNPGIFENSFLSRNANPNGFIVKGEDRNIYIGSGEMWGESFWLPKTGKVTIDNYAMHTADFLNRSSMRGKVDAEELKGMMLGLSGELASSGSGLAKSARMSIDYALYSKHVVDKKLLNADFLELKGSYGKEIENLIDNATKISMQDYHKIINQQLSDSLHIAKAENRSLVEQLEIGFGKENFFSRYYNSIEKINSTGNASEVATLITRDQARIARNIHKEIGLASRMEESVSRERYDSIRKLMLEDSLTGLWVRHPAVYGGSYSAGTILPAVGMEEKQIAIGRTTLTNLFGDHDGDASMVKGVFSKISRLQTHKLIEKTQRQTAENIRMFKDGGAIQFFTLKEDRSTAVLGKELSEKVAKQLIYESPLDTALAAFYTKSLTGALNVKAWGTKSFVEDMISNRGMTEEEITKTHAFWSVAPSLYTEQKAISSKQAEKLLGIDPITGLLSDEVESSMKSVTGLIGRITSDRMIQSIKEMNGEVHPLTIMALAHKEKLAQFKEEHVSLIKDIMDLNLNMRTIEDNRLKEVHELINPKGDFSKALSEYKNFISVNTPFLETGAGQKLGLKEGEGFIDVIAKAIKSDKGFASDTLISLIGMVNEQKKNGATADELEILIDKAINGRPLTKRAIDMLTPEPFEQGVKKGFFSDRSVVGWNQLKKFGRWLTEEGKAGGRIGGLAAATVAGFAALNMLGGDGTPESPNDLPSVNNPSFATPRSNSMLSRRTMSPDVNYNSNISLLTDNRSPHGLVSGTIHNMLGSSSVSIQDNTNPYLKDMYTYTNN